jgi:hypothetical protein
MKQTLKPNATPLEWDPQNLLNKALRYFELMFQQEKDTWNFGLFSGLALELLARAALGNVSPVLLTDCNRGPENLFHALGFPVRKERFVPRSISMEEACSRLGHLFPELDSSQQGFCLSHSTRRNAELHSGATPFDKLEDGSWLPKYYKCCDTLLKTMGLTLSHIIPKGEVAAAHAILAADEKKNEKAAFEEIVAYRKVWEGKTDEARETLSLQARTWATRQAGHCVKCPACGSAALVVGPPIGEVRKTVKEDQITEVVEHLPNKFECTACGLKISGVIKLSAAKLANHYKHTATYDALEYYAPDVEEFEYEPDNND